MNEINYEAAIEAILFTMGNSVELKKNSICPGTSGTTDP